MPVSEEIAQAAAWALKRRAREDGGSPQDGGDCDRPGPGKVKGGHSENWVSERSSRTG